MPVDVVAQIGGPVLSLIGAGAVAVIYVDKRVDAVRKEMQERLESQRRENVASSETSIEKSIAALSELLKIQLSTVNEKLITQQRSTISIQAQLDEINQVIASRRAQANAGELPENVSRAIRHGIRSEIQKFVKEDGNLDDSV